MARRTNLVGEKFGKLLVISYAYSQDNRKHYNCQCDCGNNIIVHQGRLVSKNSTHCGCSPFRKYSHNPPEATARSIWRDNKYKNGGCSFELYMKISQMNCHYCMIPASANKCNKYIIKGIYNILVAKEWADQVWFQCNGIDRIDSNKGYTEDNMVPCCSMCNYMKNNMNPIKFEDWVYDVIQELIIKKKSKIIK